jgi:hypothetical protein
MAGIEATLRLVGVGTENDDRLRIRLEQYAARRGRRFH